MKGTSNSNDILDKIRKLLRLADRSLGSSSPTAPRGPRWCGPHSTGRRSGRRRSSSAAASPRPTSTPRSAASRSRACNWRRHRWSPCRDWPQKSPAVRRARLPSRPGVRARRRNRLARGADPPHAAGAAGPIPALPAAEERGEDALESVGLRRAHASGADGGASGKVG